VPRRRDRTFLPTVLAGLVTAVLAAVAGAQDWASAHGEAGGIAVSGTVTGSDSQPLVPSLALVALAAWGALLVLRGRARRVVAVVGAVAAFGALVAAVAGFGDLADDAVAAAVAQGGTRTDAFRTDVTAWYFLAAAGSLLTGLALTLAAVRAPGWPAMGERYDAPSARRTGHASHGDATGDETDMWKALDEGRDPTS
jgi:uncharacterized membrane protein (TIGR02234 family)